MLVCGRHAMLVCGWHVKCSHAAFADTHLDAWLPVALNRWVLFHRPPKKKLQPGGQKSWVWTPCQRGSLQATQLHEHL